MFKVATFNILFGGGDEERFEKILITVKKISPNLLILQECLNWEDGHRLSQVSSAINANFAYLSQSRPRGSGRRFNIAVFSTSPKKEILDIKTHNNSAFIGHSIVELTFANKLKVFATHFDSHNENLRFVEARYLRSLINKEDFDNGNYLLAGDLNSLSLKDPYPNNFAELIEQSKTTKYHNPPRFEVITEIESFGWVDSLYYLPKENRSWITAPRDRGGVKIDYRTDYIFVSPKLAEKLQDVEIIECPEASDHFPIIASFSI